MSISDRITHGMAVAKAEKSVPQIEKFRDLAREIGTVDSEEPLNAALKKVKATPPKEEKPKKAD
ncbi:hypothetical protein NKI15_06600 [Mesorhizobium sp. M0862]|uniref:hypothetical protein n=1 Tax=Mesorhizobium sp. M0862 TaxID=2957015 RepID=UPI00333510C5